MTDEERAVLRMLVEGMVAMQGHVFGANSRYQEELFDYALKAGVLRPDEIIGAPPVSEKGAGDV